MKDRRTLKKSHYKEYTWVGADGEKVTKRLCKNNDWDQRQALDKLQKATTARHQPGQSALCQALDKLHKGRVQKTISGVSLGSRARRMHNGMLTV